MKLYLWNNYSSQSYESSQNLYEQKKEYAEGEVNELETNIEILVICVEHKGV
jgi:hypothetical protein